MSFLTESDEKLYKKTFEAMVKFENVTKLCEIVTEEGSIELNDQ